jgi:hypothetical protein
MSSRIPALQIVWELFRRLEIGTHVASARKRADGKQ